MQIRVRVLALVTAGTAVVACGTATAEAAAGKVTGGKSSITLAKAATSALTAAKVSLTAVDPATSKKDVLTFPHTGGTAAPPAYRIIEGGGILLVHGKARVSITKLVLDNDTQQVAGTITGHRSGVVFTLGDPQRGGGGPGRVQFGGYPVSWSADAAKTLDADLGTTVFAKNKRVLGIGDTDVHFSG